jgi:PTH1 family peptidyl-tRNA hydrolase
MRLFVGLGNPGQKYRNNRHNIGFMAVDEICHRHNFSGWSKKFHGEISDGTLDGEKVLLLKPATFMNLSGQAVQAAATFYKIPPADIVVFHDELDIAPGKVRTKIGGGAGGHNGLRSIDEHLGPEYWRVRMGIGHPGDKDLVSPYVLNDFFKEEQDGLQKILQATAKHAGKIIARDMDGFMTRVAQDMQPPKPPKEKDKEDTKEDVKKEKENGI